MNSLSNGIDTPALTDSDPAWHDGVPGGMRYRLEGAGTAHAVLIHELGGSLASWDEVALRLAPALRVLRYDQRGQGAAPPVREPYTLAEQVDDLGGLLAALEWPRACWLVAAAAGAAVAVDFAMRYPQRVAGLVLCAPALDVDPARLHYLLERSETAVRDGMTAIADTTLGNSWPAHLRNGNQAAFDAYRARFVASDPHGYAYANRALGSIDLLPGLRSIVCPCLFLAGEFDVQRPPARIAAQAQQVHGATFEVVASAGHLLAVQQPAAVAARIAAFIAEHSV
ncbi:alpha/beta hydrolase [Paraburkholderia jirisanensis]